MRDAQAVVLNNKVYVGGGLTGDVTAAANVYTYDLTTDTWETLQSPTRFSALTTYHNKLLLAGGEETSTGQTTNQLWVFEEGEQTWTQPLPPMPVRRWRASAVSYQDYLIVAGGYNLNTVEVFDGHQWVTADLLPKRCYFMKSTSHDGHYYLMGGYDQGTSVFYTSLQSLVEKATQHPPTSPSNTDQPSVWKTLTDTPHQHSSTTILGRALVAVGGWPNQSSLHLYFPLTQSWLAAGEMPLEDIYGTCTVTLPTGETMVIGGWTRDYSPLVYKARVKLQHL